MAFPCEISTLTIPARLPYADAASAYVVAVAGHFGFAAHQSRQLGRALLITLKDLLQHAFEPNEPQELQISCQRLAIGLKIIIKEKGLPLAPAELASLAADRRTCPLINFGSHLACVRDLWDEASFHNLGRAGAEVHLIKYFEGSRSLRETEVCPVTPTTLPPGPPPGKPETFKLRPFTPADAQAIIRLLYRTYGYSYPFEHLYYPERLIQLNAEGSLRSLVAVSSRDELAGHVALFFSKEPAALAEIGAAVVHPDFRGHGCLRQLLEFALAEARRFQLPALFGRPVTNHTYSQKVAESLSFTPCGLLLGLGPAFMSFKKIHEDLTQRESMVLMYRSLVQTPPGKNFPAAPASGFYSPTLRRLGDESGGGRSRRRHPATRFRTRQPDGDHLPGRRHCPPQTQSHRPRDPGRVKTDPEKSLSLPLRGHPPGA